MAFLSGTVNRTAEERREKTIFIIGNYFNLVTNPHWNEIY